MDIVCCPPIIAEPIVACCIGRGGRLVGADIDIGVGNGGTSPYAGGGSASDAVGEGLPLTIEFKDGEKRPRAGRYELGVPPDWNP